MSNAKKQRRAKIRMAVVARARGMCECCGDDGVSDSGVTNLAAHQLSWLDPHHITPRTEMPNGGYVLSNLIGLCSDCHSLAEDFLAALDGKGDINAMELAFAPSALYAKIGSSYERALADDENDHA